jgi:hypothetical protein
MQWIKGIKMFFDNLCGEVEFIHSSFDLVSIGFYISYFVLLLFETEFYFWKFKEQVYLSVFMSVFMAKNDPKTKINKDS